MQEIISESDLRNAILQLESKQNNEGKQLKEQFHLAINGMKPINLLKSTFKEVANSQELKDDILTTTAGLAAGYVSKTIFEKISHNPIKKILGSVLMFGVTNMVAKNPETVKSLGSAFLKIISGKRKDRVNGVQKKESV
ncbi:MAG: hypothetical protein JJE22_20630 [Bacteroidia bacterium]|nr:hypothetical protein [Bacteroidia bacterium]